ncbi:Conserved DNA-binding protein YbaB [Lentzea xinjiangensis]|uniref:Conserved DNA-binding protein YbaB n=1 Tax=Lentzea xinjiangensis TaxID=402600 RepID=A0A1H9DKQ1_9PSEU|nr:YbaB/EbfC family nucleoid-associated protein [Lentzea xinjiangensis]SEQ13981.1 Conserved DNA-binding protein YbaB [Lentzea xinjiangensis]
MHVLDEIDAAVRHHSARRRQLALAQAELAERRFTDEVPDVVRVTVNGAGELLDIELAPGCLDADRRPHLLGDRITAAVAAARRKAAGAAREALSELIGERGAAWITGGDAEPEPPPRGRRSAPEDQGTDEYFEDKDSSGFLEEQPWRP